MILDEDEDTIQIYSNIYALCKKWKHDLLCGTKDDQLETLTWLLAAVEGDEETVRALGGIATVIADLTSNECTDEQVRDLADSLLEACLANFPAGLRFPCRGAIVPPLFVKSPDGFSLRLYQSPDGVKAIPHMVWPSSIVLSRWLCLPQTVSWIQDRYGSSCRVLEVGGGTCIAGISYSMQYPSHDVVLTDVDVNAVRNASYNAKRLNKLNATRSKPVSCVVLDWDDDVDFYDHVTANSFDILLGADVVHENSMATGLWRAITRYLKPGGTACIVNPTLRSREGVAKFQFILSQIQQSSQANLSKMSENGYDWIVDGTDHQSRWEVSMCHVVNPALRAGIEEDTADIPLDFYAIMRGSLLMAEASDLTSKQFDYETDILKKLLAVTI